VDDSKLNAAALILLALTVANQTCQAQMYMAEGDDPLMLYGDEETISIASSTYKPVRLAPSVASVITADNIERKGATSLNEVLATIPGLHITQETHRQDAAYSLRGIQTIAGSQILILFNGQRAPDLYGGPTPSNFYLPLKFISRIEVMRGPGSAIYGADAFAGVINVITKNADKINGTVTGGRIGSFGSQDAWLQRVANFSGWQMAFNLEYSKSDGDHNRIVTQDFQSKFDSDSGTNASLAPASLMVLFPLLMAPSPMSQVHPIFTSQIKTALYAISLCKMKYPLHETGR